jgi:hypothetical protein
VIRIFRPDAVFDGVLFILSMVFIKIHLSIGGEAQVQINEIDQRMTSRRVIRYSECEHNANRPSYWRINTPFSHKPYMKLGKESIWFNKCLKSRRRAIRLPRSFSVTVSTSNILPRNCSKFWTKMTGTSLVML